MDIIKNIYIFREYRTITTIKEKNIILVGGNVIIKFKYNNFFNYLKEFIQLDGVECFGGAKSLVGLRGNFAFLSNGRVKIWSI